MFGYFKMTTRCPKPVYDHFRKYYCFLCRALERYYGEACRALLSYDVTVLLMILAGDDVLAPFRKIYCVGGSKRLRERLADDLARKTATLHILLIAAKLEDDVCDDGSVKAKAAEALYALPIAKAKRVEPEMWAIIRDGYAALRALEREQGDLETLENAFSALMLRIAEECFAIDDAARRGAVALASKWLYFVDAVDDLEENAEKGTFNPLLREDAAPDLAQRRYPELSRHFHALYDELEALPPGGNRAVLQYIFTELMPAETMRVFLREGR